MYYSFEHLYVDSHNEQDGKARKHIIVIVKWELQYHSITTTSWQYKRPSYQRQWFLTLTEVAQNGVALKKEVAG